MRCDSVTVCAGMGGALFAVTVLGSVALAITVLVLPMISSLILPLAICGSFLVMGITIFGGVASGRGNCPPACEAIWITLVTGLFLSLVYVAPIAIPIIVLSIVGIGACCGTSSFSRRYLCN